MMSHTAVNIVKVAAEAPELDQGDTEARPKPDPSARRIKEDAAAAKAPPTIAGHEIAGVDDSKVRSASPAPRVSTRLFTGALTIVITPSCARSMPDQSE